MQIRFLQFGGFHRPYQKQRRWLTPIIVTVVLFLGIGGYFTYQHLHPKSAPPTVEENKPPLEVLTLVETVGQYVSDLPNNEIPTVATISDVSKLDQAFFLDAEKGDKVLIYSGARLAILYRPSTKTVIRQGRVELENDKSASQSADTTASTGAVLRVKY